MQLLNQDEYHSILESIIKVYNFVSLWVKRWMCRKSSIGFSTSIFQLKLGQGFFKMGRDLDGWPVAIIATSHLRASEYFPNGPRESVQSYLGREQQKPLFVNQLTTQTTKWRFFIHGLNNKNTWLMSFLGLGCKLWMAVQYFALRREYLKGCQTESVFLSNRSFPRCNVLILGFFSISKHTGFLLCFGVKPCQCICSKATNFHWIFSFKMSKTFAEWEWTCFQVGFFFEKNN